jgi:hypothetical protein
MNNAAMKYDVRFVHKISPSAKDVSEPIEVSGGAFSDSKTLAAALRKAKVLGAGERLRAFRVEGDRVVAFPDRGIWHSIVLTPSRCPQ